MASLCLQCPNVSELVSASEVNLQQEVSSVIYVTSHSNVDIKHIGKIMSETVTRVHYFK